MAATLILSGYRVTGNIRFSDDGKRADLFICYPLPSYNGCTDSYSVTAFEEEAAKIKRLKVKSGSLIDAVCTVTPYKSQKTGETLKGFRLKDISYSDATYPEADAKQKETVKKAEAEGDKLRSAMRQLASNPFI